MVSFRVQNSSSIVISDRYQLLHPSNKLGIITNTLCLFGDPDLVPMCFWSFLLQVSEYCSSVWKSAAVSHLSLLDCVVSKAVRLSNGLVVCDLEHTRRVAALSMFYTIYCDPNHALEAVLLQVHVLARLTRLAVSVHSRYLDIPRCRPFQLCVSKINLDKTSAKDLSR